MQRFDPKRLRDLRDSFGLTGAELAQRTGLSPTQIHRLETGQRRLTVDALLAYCEALDCDVAALFKRERRVPVTGLIDSEFQILPLGDHDVASVRAPDLGRSTETVAALRWAASRRFQPMRDHIVYYQRSETGRPPDIAWNKRCLVTRRDGTQCLGWPIREKNNVHIDVGDGPVEFSVEISNAEPVLAVLPPFAVDAL